MGKSQNLCIFQKLFEPVIRKFVDEKVNEST